MVNFKNTYVKLSIVAGLFVSFLLVTDLVFAQDLLLNAGTGDLKDTLNGNAKKWAYFIDGGISLASFAYTKKPIVFFSVLGVSVFFTVLVSLVS